MDYAKMFIYLIIVLILIGISVYYVRRRLTKKQPTEFVDKPCDFIYFYTSWCPYCKKARVEWDKFKNEWNHRSVDGYELFFQEIDCDINDAMATKYKIEQYPTIKMIKDDMIIDFDAKPTVESLTLFLNSSFQ